MQNLTDDAKAIMMLCGRFGKNDTQGAVKPLSLAEYNRVAEWMINRNIRPADLLSGVPDGMVTEARDGIDTSRIGKLLSRGAAMAFAVEKWMHNGIWIVCRSDEAYPGRLKRHLKRDSQVLRTTLPVNPSQTTTSTTSSKSWKPSIGPW